MKMSYKRLWKLLIDRDMSKTALRQAAGISSSSMAKLWGRFISRPSLIDQFCDLGQVTSPPGLCFPICGMG